MLAVAAGSGCGLDLEPICEAYHECLGGTEQDVEACVRTHEMRAEEADLLGCSDEHEEWLECDYEASICQEEQLAIACAMDSDCTSSPTGIARCVSNECVIKSYGPKDPSACEQELTNYERCSGYFGGIN